MDLRVSAYGTAELLRRLNWYGRETFNAMRPTVFTSAGETRGIFKTYGNLTHMVIYGASHMTPITRPEASFGMYFYGTIYNFSHGATLFATKHELVSQQSITMPAICQAMPQWMFLSRYLHGSNTNLHLQAQF